MKRGLSARLGGGKLLAGSLCWCGCPVSVGIKRVRSAIIKVTMANASPLERDAGIIARKKPPSEQLSRSRRRERRHARRLSANAGLDFSSSTSSRLFTRYRA